MNDKARLRAQAEAIFKPKQHTATEGGQPVKDHELKAAAATGHMHRQRAERLEREATASSRPIPKKSKRARQMSLAK